MSLLLLRADAGSAIGAGHLLRCLALAQAWREDGGEAIIASRCDSEVLRRRVEASGVEFVPLTGQSQEPAGLRDTLEIAARRGSAWVVLDGYHFGPAYQRGLRAAGHRLLVIDDMAHQPTYESDILLNQNLGAEQFAYQTSPGTRLLLGPRYILLRPEFQGWRDRQRAVPADAERLLVTLGGSDPNNVTLKVIHALAEVPECEVRVLVGPSNGHADSLRRAAGAQRSRVDLLRDVADMPAMMDWADAAVSAGGSTCWELAYMGVPALLIVLAENQRVVAEGLAGAEAAVNLGWHAEVTPPQIGQALRALLASPMRREHFAARGRCVVDGDGCERVVAEMHGRPLRLRPAREADCRLLWEWANDTGVRAVSFTAGSIPWETHVGWYERKLRDPNVRIYVGIDGADNPIGQVRFDVDGAEAIISVSLDHRSRGRGLGRLALDLASRRFYRETPAARLIHAYIKSGNEASVRAFEKAGFQSAGTTTKGEHCAVHLIRPRGEA